MLNLCRATTKDKKQMKEWLDTEKSRWEKSNEKPMPSACPIFFWLTKFRVLAVQFFFRHSNYFGCPNLFGQLKMNLDNKKLKFGRPKKIWTSKNNSYKTTSHRGSSRNASSTNTNSTSATFQLVILWQIHTTKFQSGQQTTTIKNAF